MGRGQAFARLQRFDRSAAWDPGVESATMLTPEPVGLGSRFALHTRFLGRSVPLEYEVIDFDPPRRLVLRAENRFVRSVDTITFESLARLTEITYDAHLETKGPFRIAEPLLAPVFRRIGDRAAAGLRTFVGTTEPA